MMYRNVCLSNVYNEKLHVSFIIHNFLLEEEVFHTMLYLQFIGSFIKGLHNFNFFYLIFKRIERRKNACYP